MIRDLPKFVDRAFFIGFLLPVLVFLPLAGLLLRLGVPGLDVSLVDLLNQGTWVEVGIGALMVWVLAVLLLMANRPVMRLMEGYGILQHRRSPLMWHQRRRWDRLQRDLRRSRDDGDGARRIRASRRLATEFPDAPEWLLPTAFGNAVRAYETYPRVLYGVEAVWSWPRLLAVVTPEYREQIESSRSYLTGIAIAVLSRSSSPLGASSPRFSRRTSTTV